MNRELLWDINVSYIVVTGIIAMLMLLFYIATKDEKPYRPPKNKFASKT